MLLIDRLSSVADQTPDALAIVDKNNSINYLQLYRLSRKVALHLLSAGLIKGDRVAMLAANSIEYAAIFYGIWIAGGVTVALNTQAKARDVTNWLKHAEARWLFIDQNHPEFSELSSSLGSEIKPVSISPYKKADSNKPDLLWDTAVDDSIAIPEPDISNDDIASIIYTSGTTGEPKGVTLSHENLSSNVNSILAYLNLDNSDSTVNVLPFYYSYGNSILHTHIAAGAKIVLENSLLYPHTVIERISKEQVTGFSGVPSTFALILGRVKLEEYDLTSLKYITQAGGPMPPAITDKLTKSLPNTKIFIMYGQTEATARLTYLPPDKLVQKRGSIGIPIPDVRISIIGKHGEQVSPGITGEICAQGPNIMLGYWKNKKKTDSVLHDGWLHTGDLAHYDDDGYIFIDGRSSDMIKTGGNRISPKEVEEVIQEIEGVQEVVVIGVQDPLLGESIKAFIVPTPGSELTAKSIQLYCRKNLAIYKVPKAVELIDSLPKTASGKIQRFLLKQ